jgi:hypothetical protein
MRNPARCLFFAGLLTTALGLPFPRVDASVIVAPLAPGALEPDDFPGVGRILNEFSRVAGSGTVIGNGMFVLTWPKPNIRVTRGKVSRYAADASIGSMDRRASISRRKIPYGLTWP